MMQQALGAVFTATLVFVRGVGVGTVDLQIAINQVDGAGNAQAHDVIYGAGYGQTRAGPRAVIMDPVIGDLGLAVFAMRDTSSVRATRDVGNPGSARRYDPADVLYVCGLAGGAAATEYIRFTSGAIDIVHTTAINLTAPLVTINGDLVGTGKGTFTGEVASGNIGLTTHRHSGVQPGAGASGGPLP